MAHLIAACYPSINISGKRCAEISCGFTTTLSRPARRTKLKMIHFEEQFERSEIPVHQAHQLLRKLGFSNSNPDERRIQSPLTAWGEMKSLELVTDRQA
ncbi:unnamed protein product [Prunus armeniaca]|uniref:Uncharacterized protein n=1 Tax=Prunus armeniaca TaxID=36596 RepID=A0A6J5U5M0_PRUAR|nr:unnamed protein product [Prunus armeniaca]